MTEQSSCFFEKAIALGDDATNEQISEILPEGSLERVQELSVKFENKGLTEEEGAEMLELRERRLCSGDCRMSIGRMIGIMEGKLSDLGVPPHCILLKDKQEPEEPLDIAPEVGQ